MGCTQALSVAYNTKAFAAVLRQVMQQYFGKHRDKAVVFIGLQKGGARQDTEALDRLCVSVLGHPVTALRSKHHALPLEGVSGKECDA
jgi:hypothetical protein